MADSPDGTKPRCPRCGSEDVWQPPLKRGLRRWLSLQMMLLVMGISAPDPGYPHWRCRGCKDWWMQKGF